MTSHSKRSTYHGAVLWILGLQYFAIQAVVTMAWTGPFSIGRNPISDLGNTRCGSYAGRFVCSPLHGLMNLSFVVLGISMLVGAILVKQQFDHSRVKNVGFICVALAGFGTVLVGLYPENTVPLIHVFGAALPFVLGNIGMMLLGITIQSLPVSWRMYTFVSGSVGFIALLLFFFGHYFGLGEGGMERVTSYPLTIWMVLFGLYLLRGGGSGHD